MGAGRKLLQQIEMREYASRLAAAEDDASYEAALRIILQRVNGDRREVLALILETLGELWDERENR